MMHCYDYMISGFTSSTANATRSNGASHQTTQHSNSGASGRGVIPKARIKTIKMTLVIVLGRWATICLTIMVWQRLSELVRLRDLGVGKLEGGS